MPDNDAEKTATKATTAKAVAEKTATKDDEGSEAKTPRKPKRPTGKFVAKMNIDVLNPRARKDEKGNWVGARHTVAEGSVVPEFVAEDELAKFQQAGVIDHEYA